MQPKRPILIFAREARAARDLNAAFQAQDKFFPVLVVRSIEEAECYLLGIGIYANRTDYPFPRLLVLHFEPGDLGVLDLLATLAKNALTSRLLIVGIGDGISALQIQRAFDSGLNWFATLGDDLRALAWTIAEMRWVPTEGPQAKSDTP